MDIKEATKGLLSRMFRQQQPEPMDYRMMASYHEAGHALIMVKKRCMNTLEYATLVGNNPSGAITYSFNAGTAEDKKAVAENHILMDVAGRAASELYTGQEDLPGWYEGDYKHAKSGIYFLIEEKYIEKPDHLSSEEFYTQILDETLLEAKSFLTEHRNELDLLASALHERKTLSRKDVYELLGVEDNISVIPKDHPAHADNYKENSLIL